MKRLIPLFLFCTALPLFSLEIRLNNGLFAFFTTEDLTDLSYALPGESEKGLYLSEILPLMEEMGQFRLYTGDYILKTDPTDDLKIIMTDQGYRLEGDKIGLMPLPDVIALDGKERKADKIVVWMDREDKAVVREIDLFSRLHHIDVEYRAEEGIVSLLEYNSFNDRRVPDLVIFSEDKFNRMAPLLGNSVLSDEAVLKFTRQIYLTGSSGGSNQILSADFGNLDLFFPLLLRFGLKEDNSLGSAAWSDALFYLTNLYKQGLYAISTDPAEDFLSGSSDGYYGSSTILSRIKGDPLVARDRKLPDLGGMNPVPLEKRILLAVPPGSEQNEIGHRLISYLEGFGVQQRIDPRTGYLPSDSAVYPLLADSPAKSLLTEDLDKAVTLEQNDMNDKLRSALPSVYRLVVTGRLTIDEGIAEIEKYVTEH